MADNLVNEEGKKTHCKKLKNIKQKLNVMNKMDVVFKATTTLDSGAEGELELVELSDKKSLVPVFFPGQKTPKVQIDVFVVDKQDGKQMLKLKIHNRTKKPISIIENTNIGHVYFIKPQTFIFDQSKVKFRRKHLN